jgi:hypothetical protein
VANARPTEVILEVEAVDTYNSPEARGHELATVDHSVDSALNNAELSRGIRHSQPVVALAGHELSVYLSSPHSADPFFATSSRGGTYAGTYAVWTAVDLGGRP